MKNSNFGMIERREDKMRKSVTTKKKPFKLEIYGEPERATFTEEHAKSSACAEKKNRAQEISEKASTSEDQPEEQTGITTHHIQERALAEKKKMADKIATYR